MNELHLFAGAGGGILGGELLGHTCVCAVEIEPYCRKVLLQRQRDGMLPRFPIWDDVTTFDGTPWRGRVDVVCGGFPCQDISCAGKGEGIGGARSGLWSHMARIIDEVRPAYALVENSPMLVSRGLEQVFSDLAQMGYDAMWGIVSAADAGAPHLRKRIWILAHSTGERLQWAGVANEPRQGCELATGDSDSRPCQFCDYGFNHDLLGKYGCPNCLGEGLDEDPHAERERLEGKQQAGTTPGAVDGPSDGSHRGWWAVEPELGRVAHGVASRVDRLKAIGNGQVPQCAALAWRLLI